MAKVQEGGEKKPLKESGVNIEGSPLFPMLSLFKKSNLSLASWGSVCHFPGYGLSRAEHGLTD